MAQLALCYAFGWPGVAHPERQLYRLIMLEATKEPGQWRVVGLLSQVQGLVSEAAAVQIGIAWCPLNDHLWLGKQTVNVGLGEVMRAFPDPTDPEQVATALGIMEGGEGPGSR